jgi:hypothetical protein
VANPLFGRDPGTPAALAVTNPAFGEALDSQRPRRYEIGFRFEF